MFNHLDNDVKKTFVLIKKQIENYCVFLRTNSNARLQNTHILNDDGDKCFNQSTNVIFMKNMSTCFGHFNLGFVGVEPGPIKFSVHIKILMLHLMTHNNTSHSVGLIWTRDHPIVGMST